MAELSLQGQRPDGKEILIAHDYRMAFYGDFICVRTRYASSQHQLPLSSRAVWA
jgi:hypothetical protein